MLYKERRPAHKVLQRLTHLEQGDKQAHFAIFSPNSGICPVHLFEPTAASRGAPAARSPTRSQTKPQTAAARLAAGPRTSLAALAIPVLLSLVGRNSSTFIRHLMAFLSFSLPPVRHLTNPLRVTLVGKYHFLNYTGFQWGPRCAASVISARACYCHGVAFVKYSNCIYIFNVQVVDHLILLLLAFLSSDKNDPVLVPAFPK